MDITFPAAAATTAVGTQTVYLREQWTDEWVEVPYLHCTSCRWACAPTMPSAELRYRYGRGRREGEEVIATVPPLGDKTRWFVKVEFDTLAIGDFADSLKWYGIIEARGDNFEGSSGSVIRGQETFTAYGLELLLQKEIIRTAAWNDGSGEYTIAYAPDFNAAGERNRGGTADAGGYYLFSGDSTGSYWSTRQIVEYLLRHKTPTDIDGVRGMEWFLSGELPEYDRPVVRQAAHNIWALLNQLIPRERLLSWYVTVNALDELLVHVFSFTDEAIDLPGDELDGEIPANENLKTITFEDSNDAAGAVSLYSLETVDEVIVRGARRRTCFSLSYQDGTLVAGWPAELETEYEAAASGAGDYPDADEVAERQKRDADARGSDRLRSVYSRFRIPDAWDQQAGNGAGDGTDRPISPLIPGLDERPYPNRPAALELLQALPLLTGFDYSSPASVVAIDEGPYVESPPLVFFQRPEDTDRWQVAESLGYVADLEETDAAANYQFSVAVEIPRGDLALLLRVSGAPQHAIAYSDFTPLGTDEAVGQWDWQNMIVTVAVEEDRYCEGKRERNFPVAGKERRVLVVEAGDSYRLDYLVQDTVVGIDPEDGSLIRADAGEFIRDDRKYLEGLAAFAYAWHSRPRRSFRFELRGRLNSALLVGDFITAIGVAGAGARQETIASAVTAVDLRWPVSIGNAAGELPTMEYTTDFGQLNVLQF